MGLVVCFRASCLLLRNGIGQKINKQKKVSLLFFQLSSLSRRHPFPSLSSQGPDRVKVMERKKVFLFLVVFLFFLQKGSERVTQISSAQAKLHTRLHLPHILHFWTNAHTPSCRTNAPIGYIACEWSQARLRRNVTFSQSVRFAYFFFFWLPSCNALSLCYCYSTLENPKKEETKRIPNAQNTGTLT